MLHMKAEPPASQALLVAPPSLRGWSLLLHVPIIFPLFVFSVHAQLGLQQSQYRVVCPDPDAPCADARCAVREAERPRSVTSCIVWFLFFGYLL